jgi:hypothetical protein
MNKLKYALNTLLLPLILLSTSATASIIVSDFETDLSAWTGKSGGGHSGVLVADPFDATNQVLSFTALTGAGDVFTIATVTSPNNEFKVSFDYLGMPGLGGTPGDLGGFFGISKGLPGDHYWVAGTGSYPAPIPLVDDGQWHHYDLTFTSPYGASAVHFMLEDYAGSGGVAGDIFFDNLVFGDSVSVDQHIDVSEPSTLALFSLFCVGLVARVKRRK